MSASKKSKFTDPPVPVTVDNKGRVKAANTPPPPPPAPEGSDSNADAKRAKDFLFPKMPGAFRPAIIRKKPLNWLRGRYIKVFSATMGNHSMALFYCCWTQEQFEEAMDARFKRQIQIAKSALADRATFIMHKSMGLIADDAEIGPVNAQVSSALAKVVEKLKEKDADQETGGGFKVVVDGLDRSAAPPAPPAAAKP